VPGPYTNHYNQAVIHRYTPEQTQQFIIVTKLT